MSGLTTDFDGFLMHSARVGTKQGVVLCNATLLTEKKKQTRRGMSARTVASTTAQSRTHVNQYEKQLEKALTEFDEEKDKMTKLLRIGKRYNKEVEPLTCGTEIDIQPGMGVQFTQDGKVNQGASL